MFYTVTPSIFGRPLSRLPWGLLLYIWITFFLLSILLTWPVPFDRITLTNEVQINLQRAASILYYMSFSNFHSLLFPKTFFLRLFFQKQPAVGQNLNSMSKILLRMLPMVLLISYRFLFLLLSTDRLFSRKEAHNMFYVLVTLFFNLWS